MPDATAAPTATAEATATPVVTAAPAETATSEPTATAEPAATATVKPTAIATAAPTATATPEPDATAAPTATAAASATPTPAVNVLYADYLGTGSGLTQLSIVFGDEYQPADYDLLKGDLCKLMALLLRQEESVSADVLNRDWSQLPEVELSAEELEAMRLEMRIVPVELADGAYAYDISVWLHWNEQELEISAMLPSLRVCLNVDALAEEAAQYAVGYRAENAQDFRALESTLIRIPEELPATQPDEAEKFIVTITEDGSTPTSIQNTIPLPPYRHTALAANYAGAGIYRAMQVE